MDKAEDLIVKTVFDGYLKNSTSWDEIRTDIVAAARALYPGQAELLVNQIEHAWYAVGVGSKPSVI